ncbi:MAG TPA: lasso peptide biosynthesis B2 protein [Candidatus Acidoferrum sp.]|nr:lasso peptide biosynthesis B2 protein [Candidatus Acidoferrum sp.]
MWERLRRFSALERPARGLFLRAAALLPLISMSLRLRGFRKTQAFLQRFLSPPKERPDSSVPAAAAESTARMVRAAVRHSGGHPTCLEESLALWWLLGRQGIACELRIGVRKEAEKFEAHAWVERAGTALNEPEALHEHYAAFDAALSSLPPGPR